MQAFDKQFAKQLVGQAVASGEYWALVTIGTTGLNLVNSVLHRYYANATMGEAHVFLDPMCPYGSAAVFVLSRERLPAQTLAKVLTDHGHHHFDTQHEDRIERPDAGTLEELGVIVFAPPAAREGVLNWLIKGEQVPSPQEQEQP
jgi:hypothetical protein